ncbi:MAG: DUF4129 domain-containing protein [Clostridiales bacterium]|nr:DUF4129 domain-containing protein [Clostridiales bacterium]
MKGLISAILYVYLLIFLILKNQEDIDINIFSRKHVDRSALPPNMRRINLLSVLGLYALIIIIFNLVPITTELLKFGARLLALIIYIVSWVINLLSPKTAKTGENPSESSQSGIMDDAGQPSPVWAIFEAAAVIAVIVFAVYMIVKYFPAAISGVRKRIRALSARLKKLLLSAGEGGGQPEEGVDCEYIDETMTIKPLKERQTKYKIKLPDSPEATMRNAASAKMKARAAYAGALAYLKKCGIERSSRDTTIDIYQRASLLEGLSEPLRLLTDIYNDVRYGDREPELSALELAEKEMKDWMVRTNEEKRRKEKKRSGTRRN